jgi:3-dehydroquinate synthetase/shikimate kinase
VAAPHALDRHLALAGFMGARKTTIGRDVAGRLGRPFADLDAEIERRTGSSVAGLFEERGESGFRAVEEEVAADVLRSADPQVVALGGGAVLSAATRDALATRACTVLVEVEPGEAWDRVGGSPRPLARNEDEFRRLYDERRPVYEAVADARARDEDGVVLAAGGVHVQLGALELLGSLVPGEGPVELVSDARVAGIHGMDAQLALAGRLERMHELPSGEEAKRLDVLEQLWRAMRLDRGGTLVALGGGCTTDVAGFAAATYLRGVPWLAVPTTLVGQVDAAIGGKTGIDLPEGKNLVGAFHWPARVVVDPALLETLPEPELRQGRAELLKTSLLAGRELDVRGAAAFKTAVCLRDPRERGPRALLNLGHTFAHALEAASGYTLAHGDAVGLGLLAALRLSANDAGLRKVEDELAPRPVAVDREVAWAALNRDKKRAGGRIRLVLLPRDGEPKWGVELPDEDVRRELDRLIAG